MLSNAKQILISELVLTKVADMDEIENQLSIAVDEEIESAG